MPAAEPLRVLQSARLGEIYREALRLRIAAPPRGFREVIRPYLRLWIIYSAALVAGVAVKLPPGVPFSVWRWVGCLLWPPPSFALAIGVGLALHKLTRSSERKRFKVDPDVERFAEIREGRVILWPGSHSVWTFRPRFLVSCKIELDPVVPEFNHLVVCFRSCRWSMLVEDIDEAEAFVQELIRQSEWGRVG